MKEVSLVCELGKGIEMCNIARNLGFEIGEKTRIIRRRNGDKISSVQVWEATFDGSDLSNLGKSMTISAVKYNNAATQPLEVFELSALPLPC